MLKVARELLRIARLLIAFKPKGYGAWIKADGQPLFVSGPFGHAEKANEILFPKSKEFIRADMDVIYKKAFEKGWIRITFKKSRNNKILMFEMTKNVTRKAIAALEDLIFSGQFDLYIGEYEDVKKRLTTDKVDEIVTFVKG